jgi:hypothetical protein
MALVADKGGETAALAAGFQQVLIAPCAVVNSEIAEGAEVAAAALKAVTDTVDEDAVRRVHIPAPLEITT